MIERKINNVSEFLDALRADQNKDAGSVWFRGHAEAEWKLIPGLLRSTAETSETTLLNRFRQSAAMLAERRPENSFDWTFLMQHYGVPTRLLDWSESPLVSLYFAVEDFHLRPNTDAAVWCLWPTMLNKNANIVDKIEGKYIPSFDDPELLGYSTESLRQNTRIELFPVATIATRNNTRIQAQLGTFTIHHNKKIAIEDVGDGLHVAKYIIPNAARDIFLSELKLLGINRFSLFPELASVGALLKEMMK
ncbi:FRG domain-containing protein [Mesorhizobium sp. CA10]|uniref:FRG domain-containing protein n=1 Tax=Mesorhizobium sp. CA10 TaxID=588495 RepID=UPI001CCF4BDD|nr:FRG domain-containing protein [Mesorhizobium sp. CA10]MBZ9880888.1 FRG domain-containing protein [Mesorhizobium sp. CA10]